MFAESTGEEGANKKQKPYFGDYIRGIIGDMDDQGKVVPRLGCPWYHLRVLEIPYRKWTTLEVVDQTELIVRKGIDFVACGMLDGQELGLPKVQPPKSQHQSIVGGAAVAMDDDEDDKDESLEDDEDYVEPIDIPPITPTRYNRGLEGCLDWAGSELLSSSSLSSVRCASLPLRKGVRSFRPVSGTIYFNASDIHQVCSDRKYELEPFPLGSWKGMPGNIRRRKNHLLRGIPEPSNETVLLGDEETRDAVFISLLATEFVLRTHADRHAVIEILSRSAVDSSSDSTLSPAMKSLAGIMSAGSEENFDVLMEVIGKTPSRF